MAPALTWRAWCPLQDQAILDKIQREVGEMKVQERLASQKNSDSWFSWWP